MKRMDVQRANAGHEMPCPGFNGELLSKATGFDGQLEGGQRPHCSRIDTKAQRTTLNGAKFQDTKGIGCLIEPQLYFTMGLTGEPPLSRAPCSVQHTKDGTPCSRNTRTLRYRHLPLPPFLFGERPVDRPRNA